MSLGDQYPNQDYPHVKGSPAERLLKAAEMLDKRASEATEGPWSLRGHPLKADGRLRYTIRGVRETVLDAKWASPNVRYIATMHPEVGRALAAWLRDEREQLRLEGCIANIWALQVADLVLAGEQEQVER